MLAVAGAYVLVHRKQHVYTTAAVLDHLDEHCKASTAGHCLKREKLILRDDC